MLVEDRLGRLDRNAQAGRNPECRLAVQNA